MPFLYRIAYMDTLMQECPDRVVYSIPIMKDTTFEQVRAIVDLAIQKKSALTLMFHSIVEQTAGEDNWSWEKEKFTKLCGYLTDQSDKGKLSILTTAQLIQVLLKDVK